MYLKADTKIYLFCYKWMKNSRKGFSEPQIEYLCSIAPKVKLRIGKFAT